jgi:branched-subunit amino acid transport protein
VIVFAILATGGAVTWLLRVAFINFVPSSKLPSIARRAIEQVGPAALAALVATELSRHARGGEPGEAAAFFGAAIVSGAIAWRTKNPTLTVIAGIAAFWVFGSLI